MRRSASSIAASMAPGAAGSRGRARRIASGRGSSPRRSAAATWSRYGSLAQSPAAPSAASRDCRAGCRRAAAASRRGPTGCARPCACSTAVCRSRTAASSIDPAERRALAGWRAGTRTRSREGGLHAPKRMARASDEPARVGRVDDRDRSDPGAQVLGEHGPDVERRGAGARRAPSRSSRTRVLRRGAGRREHQAVVPPQVAVDERVGVGRLSRSSRSRWHRCWLRLHARHEILSRRAQVEQQLRTAAREATAPTSGRRPAGGRSMASAGSRCRAASARPSARAGTRGKRPCCGARSSPRACGRAQDQPGRLADRDARRSGTCARQRPASRQSAQDGGLVRERVRRSGAGLLDDVRRSARASATKTQFRRDTSTTMRSSSTTSRGLTRPSDRR